MRGLIYMSLLALSTYSIGQISEDFSDGDFVANPEWSGDVSEFTIDGSNQLRLNNLSPASNNESYLSLSSVSINNAVWEFKVGFDGLSSAGLSGSNKMLIYLVSDEADLEGPVNGYYVNVGNTNDEINLYSTSSGTAIIDGTDDITQSSSGFVSVRVTRDASGNWELLIDQTGGSTFVSEGTATNTDFTSSSYFGVLCDYTSTRATNFFFDDFSVTGTGPIDSTPPTIQSITAISATEVDVQFSEGVDPTTAQNTTNYTIDGSISVTNATLDADNSLVHLTTSTLTNGTTYTVTINNVEDVNSNLIAGGSLDTFEYLVFEEAVEFDVVINEFLARTGGSSTIPDVEFFELFNRSSKYISLENWTFSDNSSASGTFPNHTLRPDEFVIVTSIGNGGLFSGYGDVIEVPSFRGLNDSGDDIIITNSLATNIHEISYTSSTASITTELINPNGPDYSANNYGLSADPDGGTPGDQNSIFDDTPDTTPPTVESISVVSNTELDVTFSEVLDETSAENTANYSIDGGISVSSATLDATNNQLVHLVVDPLVSGEVRTLSVSGVQDLSGNLASDSEPFEYIETQEAMAGDLILNEFLSNSVDNNDDFIELLNISDKFIDMAGWNISDESSTSEDLASFILRPGEYMIIYDEDASIDYSTFGNALTIASLTLNNSDDQIEIVNASDEQMIFLAYEEAQADGVSLELVNPEDPCLSLDSYRPSSDASGSTPGAQNSVFDDAPDTEAPTVQSYDFDTNLTINFSEVMDAASLTSGTYSVSGGITINQVMVSGQFPTSVEISFNETIEQGILYDFTLSGVLDCSGNEIAETTISFGVGRAPGFNELIITEIMFDPDPQVELPNQEFIEVYNATSDILSIANVSLTDASSTIGLPSGVLNPGEYYVLTTNSASSEFSGNVIGVPSFPSLNNSGEQLVLTLNGELIFSLTYDPDWHDEDKSDGGVTLEMRDVSNPCLEDGNNWQSSQSSNGGTPGAANSQSEIIPDNFGPSVTSATAELSDSVRIDFDEKIDPSTVSMVSVSIDPVIGIDQIYFDVFNPSTITITLTSSLEQSVPYTLTIENIADCSGNEVQDGTVVFALPVLAESDEVKLSEVLFNPRTNGVDFVEVFNDSDKYISLRNWKLGNEDDEGEIDDVYAITINELVIAPEQFLVFTTYANTLLTNYPKAQTSNLFEVLTMPSYPNDEGTVLLIDQSDNVVERFSYNEDFHYNLLESVDGVSLERVSFEESTSNGDNWRSASSTEGFATPGYANSQSLESDVLSGTVIANPEVFIPGNAGSGRGFTTINYQLDQPGKFANVNIYDQTGRLVKNLAQGVLLSTSGFLRWDGDTNEGGIARMGYHLIIFEIYDSSGNSETIKETVVVGRDF